MRPPPEPVRIGTKAAALLGVALAVVLATGVARPVELLLAGGRAPTAPVIAEDFGPEAVSPDGTGYDGQQVYAIARWFPHLDEARSSLDAPRYRLLRILAPALASFGGRGNPVVLLLLVLNLVGCGLAVGGLAALATAHGRPPWVGYGALPPLVPAVLISTVEPLAFGLALAGVALADRHRVTLAVLAFVLAALTRETAVVVAAATALGLAVAGERRAPALYLTLPAAAIGGWYLALARIVGGKLPSRTDFLAVLDVGPASQALTVSVAVLSFAAVWWWRDTAPAWPIALAFTLWIPFYPVGTLHWLALPRVSAPSLALALGGLAAIARRRHGMAEPVPVSRPPGARA